MENHSGPSGIHKSWACNTGLRASRFLGAAVCRCASAGANSPSSSPGTSAMADRGEPPRVGIPSASSSFEEAFEPVRRRHVPSLRYVQGTLSVWLLCVGSYTGKRPFGHCCWRIISQVITNVVRESLLICFFWISTLCNSEPDRVSKLSLIFPILTSVISVRSELRCCGVWNKVYGIAPFCHWSVRVWILTNIHDFSHGTLVDLIFNFNPVRFWTLN